MNKVINYFSNVPLKNLLIGNFLIGLITGFPFMIGTILLTFSKKPYGLFILLISILLVIFLNVLINKKTKNKVNDKFVYIKLFSTFFVLGLGMICISQIAFLFMNVNL